MNERLELAHAFLAKAGEDLEIAELAVGNARLAGAVCFHAQQAAEKAIKAVLTAHDVYYPRTHDIARLLDQVAAVTGDFEQARGSLSALTVYATELRYPEAALPTPSAEEAAAALDASGRALALAARIIACAAPPQGSDQG